MTEKRRPPFDPELAVALSLAQPGELPPATITGEMIGAMRRSASQTHRLSDQALRRGGAIELAERDVPGGGDAPDVPLLICRPAGLATPTAAIYYTHGGGMIAGERRSGLAEQGLLDWAATFGLLVVSVEYRLAPENPDPAPRDDCYAGLAWTAANAEALGVDPSRILLAGASAGGGLAAALALMSRDRDGPPLLGQMLLSPMLDDRSITYSSTMLHGEGVWDRTSNLTGWTALLGDRRGGPDVSPYAAPARAVDVSDLPPTYIEVGSIDTFRDEAVDYAGRLWQAGVSAELHVWPGAFHGFELAAPHAAVSRTCASVRVDWLRRLLAPRDRSPTP